MCCSCLIWGGLVRNWAREREREREGTLRKCYVMVMFDENVDVEAQRMSAESVVPSHCFIIFTTACARV
jgi:hypothetical protein